MDEPEQSSNTAGDQRALASWVWILMSDLVLDSVRRREVAEAVGLSFARTRAIRRLARRPLSMTEIAELMDIDKPNATKVVDELEAQGLVRRTPHPTDRRGKLVEVTHEGLEVAARADEILGTPPDALINLNEADLQALRRILRQVRAAGRN
jgi:DNA-binding MarR family transcriptional regulator